MTTTGVRERARHVLQLTVEAYVAHAQPVSSGVVAQRNKSRKMSPATIRNVMAELERGGLLYQPHTSAGRVPTVRGLREYLDGAMSPKLRPWDRTRLDEAAELDDAREFPAQLGHSLAGLTGQMAVVAVPRFLGSQFREVGLVRCGERRFLAIFVSPGGLVQQKLVEVDFDLSPEETLRIQNFLNEKLAGRTLEQVHQLVRRELREHREARDDLVRRAWTIGQYALPDRELELFVQGATNLADQPEFANVDRLRQLLRAIDDKRALLKLLDNILAEGGVRVMLGSEHPVDEVAELSCVASAWMSPSGHSAAITLLGPLRMDYGRLVPLVGYATELFARYWQTL